jgi:uncharacterized protein
VTASSAAAEGAPPRIATLDIVRGVAVMGILAMNIVVFAMPRAAYLNPRAYGWEGPLDLSAYVLDFVFIEGKMRGLFSFLFGASILLVIERAEARGENPAEVHFRRMAWLLFFGLLHFFLIWPGDILTLYAVVGMAAWFFRRHDPAGLILRGSLFLLFQFSLMAYLALDADGLAAAAASGQPGPEARQRWADFKAAMGSPSAETIAVELRLYGGPWLGIVRDQLDNASDLIAALEAFGWETLAYMLFGMAGLKSGFLTGNWARDAYRKVALVGLGLTLPLYALIAVALLASGHGVTIVLALAYAATVPIRPVTIAAMAALIILLAKPGGTLTGRIAAAGRAAFTNYLGTSILMTALFYGWGFGLFGRLGRAELWLVVLPMWALMLLWSKAWLDRFRYGPFEWLWRSLARWEIQPIRSEGA